jgi:hypothetical protein
MQHRLRHNPLELDQLRVTVSRILVLGISLGGI